MYRTAAGLDTLGMLQREKESPVSRRHNQEENGTLCFVLGAAFALCIPNPSLGCGPAVRDVRWAAGKVGQPWGHGQEGKQSAPLPEPDLHPRRHARPVPHRARAYRRSPGGRGARRGATGEGRDGGGREGREGERRGGGRRPALAAGSGGGSR